jgi:hypothetical protein
MNLLEEAQNQSMNSQIAILLPTIVGYLPTPRWHCMKHRSGCASLTTGGRAKPARRHRHYVRCSHELQEHAGRATRVRLDSTTTL